MTADSVGLVIFALWAAIVLFEAARLWREKRRICARLDRLEKDRQEADDEP